MVADALVRRSTETILCVCYTNHALDQFLESLLDKGIKDIVRLGGKSKSKRLEDYNLFNLRSTNRGKFNMPQNEFRRMVSLREEGDKCQEEVRRQRSEGRG